MLERLPSDRAEEALPIFEAEEEETLLAWDPASDSSDIRRDPVGPTGVLLGLACLHLPEWAGLLHHEHISPSPYFRPGLTWAGLNVRDKVWRMCSRDIFARSSVQK